MALVLGFKEGDYFKVGEGTIKIVKKGNRYRAVFDFPPEVRILTGKQVEKQKSHEESK